jgi:indole-3-glycerol phosphate synthase
LDRIVQTKREEVAQAGRCRPLADLQANLAGLDPPRDFFHAVTAPSPHGIQLIAEIKKASPSAGLIAADFDPVAISQAYYRHGAAAVSVLTDETYFQGRLDFIEMVKRTVPLPVLRKDFIIDEYQLYEARAAGADAVLLIAEVLGADGIAELVPISGRLGMTALVEAHSAENLQSVLDAIGSPGPNTYILGINNRDLDLQRTDVNTTMRLAGLLPRGAPFVAESGISTREDVRKIRRAGACAMLVGESLLRAPSIEAQINALLGK